MVCQRKFRDAELFPRHAPQTALKLAPYESLGFQVQSLFSCLWRFLVTWFWIPWIPKPPEWSQEENWEEHFRERVKASVPDHLRYAEHLLVHAGICTHSNHSILVQVANMVTVSSRLCWAVWKLVSYRPDCLWFDLSWSRNSKKMIAKSLQMEEDSCALVEFTCTTRFRKQLQDDDWGFDQSYYSLSIVIVVR